MGLLAIENLSVAIHGTPVLRDVSLQVEAGEIVALTGESGSGKSMTALAIMGLLPDGSETRGAIRLSGQAVTELAEPALCALRGDEVGMVFQEPMTALNPVKTIGDQVAETILIHEQTSRADAAERAARMLERVGLPNAQFPLTRFPHELSGGQRQRVVIAMAIARRPALLIADEPTTALDVTTQATILHLLRDLVRDFGMGLVMITHDLAVVADLADRIAVMRAGEIVEQGPTAQVLRERAHPYTAMLFEASRHKADLPPAKDGAPLLECREVVRDYAVARTRLFAPRTYFRAVDRVSFTLPRGGRFGLVGESGCGKSTLTRALLGLEPVQGGDILLDGQPIGRDPALRRRISVVFQDPNGSFNPRHRVDRLITEPFFLLDDPPKGTARQAAIAEALEAVGLQASDGEKYIHEFSGGQRQRIAIARALIIRPEVIIFDEAVSALDVSVRAQVLDLLAELVSSHDLSYLFISHDLTVVRSITDHVLVMRAGQIVEQGPTEQVLSAPAHGYTQSLIDAAPVLPDYAAQSPKG